MFDEFSKSMDLCTACPSLCQSACPVFREDGNKSHSPWGLMQVMNRVRRGDMAFTPEVAELSYRCLTCQGCTEQCEHGVQIPPLLHRARVEAVRRNVAPASITGFVEKFHRHNNPFSKDLLLRLKTLVPKKALSPDHQVVYYASCTTISKCPEVVRDTFSLFKKLKIDFVGVYGDPMQCCGYPLLTAGAEYEFVDIAEINYHSLNRYKMIIVGSPACAHTFKNTYAQHSYDLSSRIVTINEFLKPYLKNINYRLKKNLRSKLMYHDPCYLSRYLGEVDLPREMIAQMSGYQPVEFYDNREKTSCSGQGGCYSITDKDAADAITKERLNEVYEKNISTVLTQCPTCVFKMRQNSRQLVVKDLISYLNDCIEGTDE